MCSWCGVLCSREMYSVFLVWCVCSREMWCVLSVVCCVLRRCVVCS